MLIFGWLKILATSNENTNADLKGSTVQIKFGDKTIAGLVTGCIFKTGISILNLENQEPLLCIEPIKWQSPYSTYKKVYDRLSDGIRKGTFDVDSLRVDDIHPNHNPNMVCPYDERRKS